MNAETPGKSRFYVMAWTWSIYHVQDLKQWVLQMQFEATSVADAVDRRSSFDTQTGAIKACRGRLKFNLSAEPLLNRWITTWLYRQFIWLKEKKRVSAELTWRFRWTILWTYVVKSPNCVGWLNSAVRCYINRNYSGLYWAVVQQLTICHIVVKSVL